MHKQPLSAFLAAIVFILVLLLDVACQPAAGQESVATPYDAERVREIDTARWVGIGEYYRQLQKAPEPERVSLLATARYTGQALQQYGQTGNPIAGLHRPGRYGRTAC